MRIIGRGGVPRNERIADLRKTTREFLVELKKLQQELKRGGCTKEQRRGIEGDIIDIRDKLGNIRGELSLLEPPQENGVTH